MPRYAHPRHPGGAPNPPPDGVGGVPRVGPERLEALARKAMSQLDPEQYVSVLFEGEPRRARLLCNACDEYLQATPNGEWACADGCRYVLTRENAARVVRHYCTMLGALVPSAVGLAPVPSPSPWWSRLWMMFRH